MEMSFVERPIKIIDLPLGSDYQIENPELIIIRFPNGKTADIGALCYMHRSPTPKNWRINKTRKCASARLVDLGTLNKERSVIIRDLIPYISDYLCHSGKRTETVRDLVTRFIAFMYWADINEHYLVLNNVVEANSAISAYVNHLREKIKNNSLSISGAVSQQKAVIIFLEGHYEVDDLRRGVNLIRKKPIVGTLTIAPSEDTQARVLTLCNSLFDGLSNLFLNFKNYPYALKIPSYLNYPKNIIWIFPTIQWFKLPSTQSKRYNNFNYTDGRLTTPADLADISKDSSYTTLTSLHAINSTKKKLENANSDKHNTHRMHQGMNAQNFFILMFLAETGMNWAQLVNLTWSDDYQIAPSNQKFRAIKGRANNREVYFELPRAFIPKFKKFIEIRKYLLNGRDCPWLFFKLGNKGYGDPAQIKSGPSATYSTLKRIDPDLISVMPREWRAAKSDWLIKNTDPATAAAVLQNSEKTILKHYAAGSETVHVSEMSNFLNKISKTVISNNEVIDGSIGRIIGICSKFGSPHQPNQEKNIKSDCASFEGCFFCDKYKVHADEKDARKLLSCRYCILQTAHLAETEEHFKTFMKPILNRINEILSEISSRDNQLISKLTKEIEEFGELDSYWSRKLEMLIDLELLE